MSDHKKEIHSQLEFLENEAIYILRETQAQFTNPHLLFSGGKDSIVMVHLAKKAFWPASIPFPLMHIDTGHNFLETLEFRDNLVKENSARLVIKKVQDSIDQGRVIEETGRFASRNMLQTTTLLDAIEELHIDACLGGARRDEEKARAKERIYSIRDDFGAWDPRRQRPEVWNLYNGKIQEGENVRIFPLSNWTELDIWNYIKQEEIEVPSIYFSHTRNTFIRKEQIFPISDFLDKSVIKEPQQRTVRFRTIGDMTCTAAVESDASDVSGIIQEIKVSKITERGARLDDKRSDTAMEDRKKTGYF